jgi:hypothetical protein
VSHPFEGTPQYEQVYGNKQGPPIGRQGNGLGFCGKRMCSDAATVGSYVEATESDGEATIPEEWGITPDHLYEALGRLTARQVFVIRLVHGLGGVGPYSTHEIADMMGLAQPTVFEHYQAGMEKLRKTLSIVVTHAWENSDVSRRA